MSAEGGIRYKLSPTDLPGSKSSSIVFDQPRPRLPAQTNGMCIYSFTCSSGAGSIRRTSRRLSAKKYENTCPGMDEEGRPCLRHPCGSRLPLLLPLLHPLFFLLPKLLLIVVALLFLLPFLNIILPLGQPILPFCRCRCRLLLLLPLLLPSFSSSSASSSFFFFFSSSSSSSSLSSSFPPFPSTFPLTPPTCPFLIFLIFFLLLLLPFLFTLSSSNPDAVYAPAVLNSYLSREYSTVVFLKRSPQLPALSNKEILLRLKCKLSNAHQ
nr:unnamed protein product [Spirometra erinaceieuropaei]